MAYNMNTNMAAQSSADVSRFLEAGERIVWQGQPRKGSMVGGLQLAGWIVLGVGTLLALVFIILGITLGGPPREFSRGNDPGAFLWVGIIIFFVMDMMGVTFLLIGNAGGGGRNINYILTDRHALIAQGPSYGTVRTTLIDLADISIVRVLEGKNGTGSIIFGRGSYNSANVGSNPSYYDRDYSFTGIADVLSVYRLLRQTQESLTKPQA